MQVELLFFARHGNATVGRDHHHHHHMKIYSAPITCSGHRWVQKSRICKWTLKARLKVSFKSFLKLMNWSSRVFDWQAAFGADRWYVSPSGRYVLIGSDVTSHLVSRYRRRDMTRQEPVRVKTRCRVTGVELLEMHLAFPPTPVSWLAFG